MQKNEFLMLQIFDDTKTNYPPNLYKILSFEEVLIRNFFMALCNAMQYVFLGVYKVGWEIFEP